MSFKIGDKVKLDINNPKNREALDIWDFDKVFTVISTNEKTLSVDSHLSFDSDENHINYENGSDWFHARFISAEPELFHDQLEKLIE